MTVADVSHAASRFFPQADPSRAFSQQSQPLQPGKLALSAYTRPTRCPLLTAHTGLPGWDCRRSR
eukprot:2514099-Rhodomonas_salina.1